MEPTVQQQPQPPAQRPRFPRWGRTEQALWIDLLDSYSCAMLEFDMTEEQAVGKIRLAATLADTAIQEMQYRFWIQKPPLARKPAHKPARRPRR